MAATIEKAFGLADECGTHSPAPEFTGSEALQNVIQTADAAVGGVGQPLTEDGREEVIVRLALIVHRHTLEWERQGVGCFAAKGMADRAQRLLDKLLRRGRGA